jgi:hypothetical protein
MIEGHGPLQIKRHSTPCPAPNPTLPKFLSLSAHLSHSIYARQQHISLLVDVTGKASTDRLREGKSECDVAK